MVNSNKIQLADKEKLINLQKKYREATKSGDFLELSGNSDTVTLYHGTSTHLLPDILANGLKPRALTGIDNWTHVESSLDNLVYLSNKWHYFFSVQTTTNYYEDFIGEDWSSYLREKNEAPPSIPCYIEVEVPVSMLTLDEDIFLSDYVQELYSETNGNPLSAFKVEEVLARYGTLAHVGTIPPSAIKSFTLLPDLMFLLNCIQGDYFDDYTTWQKGKGIGTAVKDLNAWEKQFKRTKKYDVALLPKNKTVKGVKLVGINPTASLLFEKH